MADDTLGEEELANLRSILAARKATLLDTIRQELLAADQEHFQDLAGRVHDVGEEAVADLLMDLGLANIHRHAQEVREIEQAQRRMTEGTYGLCIDCDSEIELPRLKAQPTAIRCYECQTRHEREFSPEAG